MIIQSKFLYAGHHRLSYGWDNPNCAAAVLVCVLPLIWCCYRKGGGSSLRFALLLVESVTTLLLVLTYSRGAIVGFASALLFYHLIPGSVRGDIKGETRRRKALVWRFGLMAVLILASGLGQRMASVAEGDASAVNRLELWHGGLRLIAASPLVGWGRGSSGPGFTQWVQDVGSNHRYGGMVNSYLHIAVDYGLGGFAALLCFLLMPVVLGLRRLKSFDGFLSEVVLSCASGMVAFAVANIFTTLWMIPSVIWAPGLLCIFILGCTPLGDLGKGVVISVGVALAVALVLGSAAIYAAHGEKWGLKRHDDGSVEFFRRNVSNHGTVPCFLPDRRLLGNFFGREIREATERVSTCSRFVIFPPGMSPRHLPENVRFIAFGNRVEEIETKMLPQTIIVFPSVIPPTLPPKTKPLKIVLPQLDQVGFGRQWRKCAQEHHCTVHTIPLTGQDLEGQLADNWTEITIDEPAHLP